MSADLRSFSDKYFVRASEILSQDRHDPHVLMQIFCRRQAMLCGVQETLSLLQNLPEAFIVHGLDDGDSVEPWETVLTIEGPYRAFAHMETIYLGVLARGTRVATQTRDIVQAAGAKPVLFFGGRHDHYLTQEADGYAARLAGASGVATDAQGLRRDVQGVGTVPTPCTSLRNPWASVATPLAPAKSAA